MTKQRAQPTPTQHHLTFRFDVTGLTQQQLDTIVEEAIESAIRNGATLTEYGMEGSHTFKLEGFGRPSRGDVTTV